MAAVTVLNKTTLIPPPLPFGHLLHGEIGRTRTYDTRVNSQNHCGHGLCQGPQYAALPTELLSPWQGMRELNPHRPGVKVPRATITLIPYKIKTLRSTSNVSLPMALLSSSTNQRLKTIFLQEIHHQSCYLETRKRFAVKRLYFMLSALSSCLQDTLLLLYHLSYLPKGWRSWSRTNATQVCNCCVCLVVRDTGIEPVTSCL